ncbi:hypothetical protein N0V84_005550 [Fusarium piperis]|uniref:Uncharacterized protein n=1 Tax=Fusarium piperis TaxID=1435070 RepID=A0A9W8WDW6_9HYPO|nr:hypothetical protein N0V84_005550 [Fusarium piperis]
MAYDGGYGGQQRPYGGPAPQRPAPRQQGGAPPQQYGAPQQYDDYQGGYGYDGYNEGYGQEYGGQYQDQNYGRGPPPPQDPYGPGPGRGGRPMPGGRGGGPVPRPQTADPHRGRAHPPRGGIGPAPGRGMPHGPPGRGGMRPGPHGAHSDPAASEVKVTMGDNPQMVGEALLPEDISKVIKAQEVLPKDRMRVMDLKGAMGGMTMDMVARKSPQLVVLDHQLEA